MNLNTAFDAFCKYLLKYKENFENLTGRELGSFKTHYKDHHNIITKAINMQIFLPSLNMALYNVYKDLENHTIHNDCFTLLKIIVDKNPNFGKQGQLGKIPLDTLKKKLERVIEYHSSLSNGIVDISQTQNGSENNNSETRNVVNEDNNPIIEQTKIKLSRLFKRLQHKEISKRVFEFHTQNGTVPDKLDFNRFPRPFLDQDIIFVEEYNKLIKEFQEKIISLCNKRLDEQITSIKNNISQNKSKISNLVEDVETKIKNLEEEAKQKASKQLEKALDKASQRTVKSYFVRFDESGENVSVDENWFDLKERNPDRDSNEIYNNRNNNRYERSNNDSRSRENYREAQTRNKSRNREYHNSNRPRNNSWNRSRHRSRNNSRNKTRFNSRKNSWNRSRNNVRNDSRNRNNSRNHSSDYSRNNSRHRSRNSSWNRSRKHYNNYSKYNDNNR